jgi:hypothetical protein
MGQERINPKIVRLFFLAAIVVAAALAFSCAGGEEKGKSFNLKGKETRPLLDASMFSGQVRAAYAAAKKYPDVLNEVFCYCFCNEPPFKHLTLLSCFADRHGAG